MLPRRGDGEAVPTWAGVTGDGGTHLGGGDV